MLGCIYTYFKRDSVLTACSKWPRHVKYVKVDHGSVTSGQVVVMYSVESRYEIGCSTIFDNFILNLGVLVNIQHIL